MTPKKTISVMPFSDQAYQALCRKQIEKKNAFGKGEGYTQRELFRQRPLAESLLVTRI